jgi:hypothetical protein
MKVSKFSEQQIALADFEVAGPHLVVQVRC